MEDSKIEENTPSDTNRSNNEDEKFNLIGFDKDTPQQSVFKFLGIEMTAPAGMKNPGRIYLLFVVVNLVLFVLLKSRL